MSQRRKNGKENIFKALCGEVPEGDHQTLDAQSFTHAVGTYDGQACPAIVFSHIVFGTCDMLQWKYKNPPLHPLTLNIALGSKPVSGRLNKLMK